MCRKALQAWCSKVSLVSLQFRNGRRAGIINISYRPRITGERLRVPQTFQLGKLDIFFFLFFAKFASESSLEIMKVDGLIEDFHETLNAFPKLSSVQIALS